ncbi:discoidin domain-containing protein [Micromonospora sp. NPDC051300]|uniref:discoidin domain-containing protein n=1 Tax=Micromonospora sp. NPDC051300 TaxID=3364286 RepID=UPI0037BB832E
MSNQYVQALSVNGTARQRPWLRYGDVAGGATLAYTMGGAPSAWGTNPSDVPPSFTDGATPPPAAPELGPNLAAGKPVTGSAACASSEGPEKAVDGRLGGASKWCSLATDKFLQVDLGSAQTVRSFVVKHAGLGGETTGWNTGAFTIATSTDGVAWTNRVSVSGSRSSRTYHPITAVSARYVRLNVTTPTNNGNNAARIDEFEVYGAGGANLALNRPATADSQCASTEGPEKAVNGSVSGGAADKWCSTGTNRFLRVDLGSSRTITAISVSHAGAGGEDRAWNTRDFDLQVSADGSTWTTAAAVRGNTADVSEHRVTASGRFVRVSVLVPTQNGDPAARLYEVEVFGT